MRDPGERRPAEDPSGPLHSGACRGWAIRARWECVGDVDPKIAPIRYDGRLVNIREARRTVRVPSPSGWSEGLSWTS